MRSACRGSTSRSAILAAMPLVAGCGAGESEARPLVAPAPPPSRWAAFEEAGTWERVAEPFPSAGHAPHRFTIAVRVDAAALVAYRAALPGAALPDGARIAAFHAAKDGSPASVYFMTKAGGAWTFGAADATGLLLRGDTQLCAACHADAPGDHVFGIPRTPARGPGNG